MSEPLTTTADRLTRALRSGPMFEGALYLVFSELPTSHVRRNLRHLQTRGVIERTPGQPQTWRLVQP